MLKKILLEIPQNLKYCFILLHFYITHTHNFYFCKKLYQFVCFNIHTQPMLKLTQCLFVFTGQL